MARRRVVRLQDVGDGLKLALRGRVQLRQDLIDFDNPRETMHKVDELSEDLVYNGLIDMGRDITYAWDRTALETEVRAMMATEPKGWPDFIRTSSVLRERLEEIENMGRERFGHALSATGDTDVIAEAGKSRDVEEEYLASAAEFILNLCATKKWIPLSEATDIYIPREVSWAQKANWK
jgi:hypothetical protein